MALTIHSVNMQLWIMYALWKAINSSSGSG